MRIAKRRTGSEGKCFTILLKTAFRFLPFSYLALAFIFLMSLAAISRPILVGFQTHDEGVLSDWMPLLTLISVAAIFATASVLNALFLFRKTHHRMCLVLSALSCLAIPFGTALGAASIFLLTREEIRGQYRGGR
jgi:hypothetical protein